MGEGRMSTDPTVRECSREDIIAALEDLWPKMATARGIDGLDPSPLLDGHFGVGFSLRLFGSGVGRTPESSKAAYVALDDVLSAMEERGFAITRDGNQWQPGRLVLGYRVAA